MKCQAKTQGNAHQNGSNVVKTKKIMRLKKHTISTNSHCLEARFTTGTDKTI